MKLILNKTILFSFLFIPWTEFWQQNSNHFKDLSKVEVALAKDCSKPISASDIIRAEVATTPTSKEKGLGFRKNKLVPNQGMIFVFDPPVQPLFWMKNTYIPLQIAYFNTSAELFQLIEMDVEKDPKNPIHKYPANDLASIALEVAPRRIKNDNIGMRLCVKNLKK